MEKAKHSRFLLAGTILVPKPEWVEYYKKINLIQYLVTDDDEKQNATIGDKWMLKTT